MSLGFAAIAENPIASGDDSLGLAIATPSGLSATSALGSVTAVPQGVFAVTGEEATTAVGTVEAYAEFIAEVTGLEAIASLDEDYVVSGSAPVSVTGEEATSGLGSVTIGIVSNVFPTGAEATGGVGTLTAPAAAQPSIIINNTQAQQQAVGGTKVIERVVEKPAAKPAEPAPKKKEFSEEPKW